MPIHLVSQAEKVRWLLKNKHFEVICKKNEAHHRLVSFSLIKPAFLEWEIIHECVLSGSEVTPLSDGSFISYGNISNAMICNWKTASSSFIPNQEPTHYVSCVEISSDLQAFASSHGNIEIRERGKGRLSKVIPDSQIIEKDVSRSLSLLSTGFLCETRYSHHKIRKVVLWDWKNEKKFQEIIGCKGFIELYNKDLLFFTDFELFFYRIQKSGKKYTRIKENHVATYIDNIFELENKRILILTKSNSSSNKACLILDPITDEPIFIQEFHSVTSIFPFLQGIIGVDEDENRILYNIDSNKIVYLSSDLKELPYPLTSFCQLSDGTIAFGHQNGKFYIYDQNGNCLVTMNFNSWIVHIIELADGSLAVKTLGKTFILHPKKKVNKIALKIAVLEMKVKLDPEDFSIYPKLVEGYRKQKETDKEYQLYLQGIGIAMRCNNYYKARRFFEHATALYPEKQEPFLLFLNQLNDTNDLSLKQTVLIKLHKLLEKEKAISLPELLCTKMRCKSRLVLEDANFSYTERLLYVHKETHLKLADSIIATKLVYPTTDGELEQVGALRKKGVAIKFNVNTGEIHDIFRGKRIERIHLNCPNMRNSIMIAQFFKSASQLQISRDRIHVILFQDPLYWAERQQESGIVSAATYFSYRLIRKRLFRYSDNTREFIFEKIDQNDTVDLTNIKRKAQILCDPRIKPYQVGVHKRNKENLYFECSTDEDSSDYFATEFEDAEFQ